MGQQKLLSPFWRSEVQNPVWCCTRLSACFAQFLVAVGSPCSSLACRYQPFQSHGFLLCVPGSNPPAFVCLCVCVCEGRGQRSTSSVCRYHCQPYLFILCMGVGWTFVMVLLWGSEDFWESLFSFHCMNLGDQTQVISVSGKCLSLLSHLSAPAVNLTF